MERELRTREGRAGAPRLLLMRGLPSCGKSWTARRIAARQGGLALEFDAFFEGPLSPHGGLPEFHWSRRALPAARRAHFALVREALDAGVSPVVADDDHRPGPTAKAISAYAISKGYTVEFREPESPWWRALRPLLEDKQANRRELGSWAQKLCRLSAAHHRVPLASFVARIERWNPNLTLLDILAWGEELAAGAEPSTRSVA